MNNFLGKNDERIHCRGILHIVKDGDTLYKIAKKHGVPLSRVMYANPYVDVYNLQIGDEICVPVPVPHPPKPEYPEGGRPPRPCRPGEMRPPMAGGSEGGRVSMPGNPGGMLQPQVENISESRTVPVQKGTANEMDEAWMREHPSESGNMPIQEDTSGEMDDGTQDAERRIEDMEASFQRNYTDRAPTQDDFAERVPMPAQNGYMGSVPIQDDFTDRESMPMQNGYMNDMPMQTYRIDDMAMPGQEERRQTTRRHVKPWGQQQTDGQMLDEYLKSNPRQL